MPSFEDLYNLCWAAAAIVCYAQGLANGLKLIEIY